MKTMNKRSEISDGKGVSSPHVQDMLQKFEVSTLADKVYRQDVKKVNSFKFKRVASLKDSVTINQDGASPCDRDVNGGRKFQTVHGKTGANPPTVSVVQRTKLFQGLSYEEPVNSPQRTFRSSVKIKVRPSKPEGKVETDLGPLPTGPPPRKPPRASIILGNNIDSPSQSYFEGLVTSHKNSSIAAEQLPPVPSTRLKLKKLKPEILESGQPVEVSKATLNEVHKHISFLHGNFDKGHLQNGILLKEKTTLVDGENKQKSLNVVVNSVEAKMCDKSSNGGPTSPRSKGIQRPKVPPPRPPPPQNVQNDTGSHDSKVPNQLIKTLNVNEQENFKKSSHIKSESAEDLLYDQVIKEIYFCCNSCFESHVSCFFS